MPHPLDNPIFESLANRHRPLALQQGEVLRYPPGIAPFLGVPEEGHDDPAALHALVPPGDTVLMLGKMTARWPCMNASATSTGRISRLRRFPGRMAWASRTD